MPFAEATDDDSRFMKEALAEAQGGYDEGGVPVGSVMVEDGRVIARGRNKRVQEGDPIAHGEMDCIRAAGRRPGYRKVTLYTTLSPCLMCSGTILQFEIPRVVVGEDRNFEGDTGFLAERGVEVVMLDDPDCIALMERFIREKPELWNEDIAKE
ncbi:MAG: nucleoside deaminase [Rhodospirillales bacterium]|nr:nucleoside deaminase [Rhodospirillales bacterium]